MHGCCLCECGTEKEEEAASEGTADEKGVGETLALNIRSGMYGQMFLWFLGWLPIRVIIQYLDTCDILIIHVHTCFYITRL